MIFERWLVEFVISKWGFPEQNGLRTTETEWLWMLNAVPEGMWEEVLMIYYWYSHADLGKAQ
jgi:hypothetical protein